MSYKNVISFVSIFCCKIWFTHSTFIGNCMTDVTIEIFIWQLHLMEFFLFWKFGRYFKIKKNCFVKTNYFCINCWKLFNRKVTRVFNQKFCLFFRYRKDFLKEIKIMSQLKDPNIVRVLGVCTGEEPLCMIVEYMKYGDLNQFLLEHVLETPSAQAVNAKILRYGKRK